MLKNIITSLAVVAFIGSAAAQDLPNSKSGNEIAKKIVEKAKEVSTDSFLASLPDVLATYGDGQKITKETIMPQVTKIIQMMQTQGGKEVNLETIKNILEQYISQEALISTLSALADKAGVKYSKEEVQKQIDDILASPMGEQMLAMQGLTKENALEKLSIYDKIQKYINKEVTSKLANTSEEDAKKFYEENKAEYFTQAPGREVFHILVETEEEAKAIHQKIKSGEKFAELAKASKCPSGQNGGTLGVVANDDQRLDKTFLEAAIKLKSDEYSAPVKTQFGWHIIKAGEVKKEATVIPFEEVKENITTFLKDNKSQEATQKYIEEIKNKANIKLNF